MKRFACWASCPHLICLPIGFHVQAAHPDSIHGANIRACNEFRVGGAAAALHSLGSLPHQLAAAAAAAEGSAGAAGVQRGVLIRHNAVVFGDGQGGMQVGVVQAEAGRLETVMHLEKCSAVQERDFVLSSVMFALFCTLLQKRRPLPCP
jgi:hypothetical protein